MARQYGIEAVLLVSAALATSLIAVAIAASIVKNRLGMDLMAVLLTSPGFWAVVLLIAAVVCVLASAYPTLVLVAAAARARDAICTTAAVRVPCLRSFWSASSSALRACCLS